VQVYRKDLYDAQGLKPAETFGDFLRNARAVHDPSGGVWGAAMRGYAGPGQNMYVYPSVFRAFGGKWIGDAGVRVNSPQAVAALDWYVHMLRKYAPPQVRDWNWPEIAGAFARGTLGGYLDAHSSAALLNDPSQSAVIGKIGYARWPKGPSGRRTASIWNWSFPIAAALTRRAQRATWLFITWATCEETQARTSFRFPGAAKRTGVNRLALWRNADFVALMGRNGHNFVEAVRESLEHDTDIDWRPRVPQWPQIGERMAVAIRAALVGERTSKAALDEAQADVVRIMKG
jgi:ABC-type glycerol-3-phosphate transport system substrate-binding protein